MRRRTLSWSLISMLALAAAQACGGDDEKRSFVDPDAGSGGSSGSGTGGSGASGGSGGSGASGGSGGSAGTGSGGDGGTSTGGAAGDAGSTAAGGAGAVAGMGGSAGTTDAGTDSSAGMGGMAGSAGAAGSAGSAGSAGAGTGGSGGSTGGTGGTGGSGGSTGGTGGVPGADARCPNTANQCNVNGNYCCWEDPTASCIPDSADCQGLEIRCDGAGDCPSGEVCCYTSSIAFGASVGCRATCETSGSIIASTTRRLLCNPSTILSCLNAPSGHTCKPQTGLPAGYNTCQP